MILRIIFVFIIYVVIVALLFILRPPIMFDESGNVKQVGFTSNDKSLFSLYLTLPILAVILYLVFLAWTK